jgi:hypothetical protein
MKQPPLSTARSQHMRHQQQLQKKTFMPCMALQECSAQEMQSWVHCQTTSMPATAAQHI